MRAGRSEMAGVADSSAAAFRLACPAAVAVAESPPCRAVLYRQNRAGGIRAGGDVNDLYHLTGRGRSVRLAWIHRAAGERCFAVLAGGAFCETEHFRNCHRRRFRSYAAAVRFVSAAAEMAEAIAVLMAVGEFWEAE